MLESVPTVALAGAVGLGLLHGAEPGHGWPVAATYALDRPNKWAAGLAASTVLGVGHLVSSLAVVGVFFLFKTSVGFGSMRLLDYVAGGLLVLLGVYEYRRGHSHGVGDGHSHGVGDGHSHGVGDAHSHDHGHDDAAHDHADPHGHGDHGQRHGDDHTRDNHDHGGSEGDGGVLARLRAALPSRGHTHDEEELEAAADRGIWGIAGTAFVLGFAHEEEFEIIALCTGSSLCLELMVAYALAVILALVALTLLLVAGYEHYEERVSRLAEHFPTISAVVLVTMGLGFLAGVL